MWALVSQNVCDHHLLVIFKLCCGKWHNESPQVAVRGRLGPPGAAWLYWPGKFCSQRGIAVFQQHCALVNKFTGAQSLHSNLNQTTPKIRSASSQQTAERKSSNVPPVELWWDLHGQRVYAQAGRITYPSTASYQEWASSDGGHCMSHLHLLTGPRCKDYQDKALAKAATKWYLIAVWKLGWSELS